MSTILAIDTASNDIALAVAVDGVIVASIATGGGHEHSRMLLSMVDEILGERRTSLSGVAVVRGPGSYAGLRVGIATAQGLALAAGVPVRGISTMEAAAAASKLPQVTMVHPAGRGEFAAQEFADGKPAGSLRACRAEDLEGLTLAGEGARTLGGMEVAPEARVRAALEVLLPEFESDATTTGVEALYLREPNITVPRRPSPSAAR